MLSLLRVLFFALFITSVLAGTTQEGLDWLAAKGKEEGVVTRPSGLLYKELRAGTGKTPKVDSPTKCHYEGRLMDGTVFDSSYKRGHPATFRPNQVIKGWTEAMQMMQEGGKWELYLPSELAYGDRGAGKDIPPGAVLIFTLEMLEVLGDAAE
eukprot:CAMPEP_0119018274 /NCGR_PEP_ID=MMETSP1176-20130426/18954_1 /TAXON_ID=265551 /ORGANISM="Synedropsis recta cf, Strain CCMP1620" /LENGTH=152 /DNA_ID=CAMNT_0006972233 /DNA_START=12 /DNA_END=470 /DNA_ORIENTATION=+